jgi:hypothetical protein
MVVRQFFVTVTLVLACINAGNQFLQYSSFVCWWLFTKLMSGIMANLK